MTNDKLLKLLQQLLFSYLRTTKSKHVWLCIHTFDMFDQGKITAEEARCLRRYIISYINDRVGGIFLNEVYPYKYVKVLWVFRRKETHRELRIRWLNEQIDILAEQN